MNLVMGDALYPFLPEIAVLVREQLPEISNIENHEAIAIVIGGKVAAVVLYGDYTRENIQMHIASKNKRWCQKRVLRGLFSYPFNQLRVRRVTALIAKRNKTARHFIERIGFQHEGTHPESLPDGGALCSYGMMRKNCKWL